MTTHDLNLPGPINKIVFFDDVNQLDIYRYIYYPDKEDFILTKDDVTYQTDDPFAFEMKLTSFVNEVESINLIRDYIADCIDKQILKPVS